ncbi:SOS response-associated peptidase [Chromohalobacter sp. TMW 2.2308]|uniref:SOS response-associated peptidase n=1 Tax=Chromohalobacter TaxID=42054 RepID=UPI001FFC598E|nr:MULTISPECIES: SOS response-associated peptidase [Chromohalobacter]MCK2042580.1 SOS response-associated peptidase [Chromohalobacter moromii]MCT8514902.1 SOS response-associated peptidase [Chromohalobacter sp. TMW 2.2271]
MCGRFAFYSQLAAVAKRLKAQLPADTPSPRYNVSPGTWITGVGHPAPDSEPTIDRYWWGYHPAWAGESAPSPINAKVEKVATSNYYKGAFARHRILIPADGWYEWLPVDGRKQPHFICREDREPIYLAAIWAERADGSPGCAILTEPARGIAAEIHSRMPVALDDESLEPWLDPHLTDRESIRGAVGHLPAKLLTHWAVDRRVGNVKNDTADLPNPA